MANVLLTQVHRKRIVFEEAEAFLSLIGEMAIDIDKGYKRKMNCGLHHGSCAFVGNTAGCGLDRFGGYSAYR